mmetsp:Transcript_23241/g.72809  ORF Transcript_23241/g.72809 Transcript_23241/m.72809 type:complete len:819 (+) Transcript_23241:226-2682(+)
MDRSSSRQGCCPGDLSSVTIQRCVDARAKETLVLKNRQLELLSAQNAQLLQNLERVEDAAKNLQLEKLAMSSDNCQLRDENFTLRNSYRAATSEMNKQQADAVEVSKQLQVVTEQNSELLRLLEIEEEQCAKVRSENRHLSKEVDTLKGRFDVVLASANTHEEMAKDASRECKLRGDEVRLLRTERDKLLRHLEELRLKTQVDVESLHEQLRARKEKVYQLLGKLQEQERAAADAENRVAIMEEKLRQSHSKCLELDAHLRDEQRNRHSKEAALTNMTSDFNGAMLELQHCQRRSSVSDRERLKMESEARDSGEQLREIAEKVFQLLERLKLAEVGKQHSLEEVSRKQVEINSLAKKNMLLTKELASEGRCRAKNELDLKLLRGQVKVLKKHNTMIAHRCREEVGLKLAEREVTTVVQRKVQILGARLDFLLSHMQTAETGRVEYIEQVKRLEAQVRSAEDQIAFLTSKLEDSSHANRLLSQALELKQRQIPSSVKISETRDCMNRDVTKKSRIGTDEVRRVQPGSCKYEDFTLEVQQGTIVLIAKTKEFQSWLEEQEINLHIAQAQKTSSMKELLVGCIGTCHRTMMSMDQKCRRLMRCAELNASENQKLMKHCASLWTSLASEEQSKRRTLIRYVDAARKLAARHSEDEVQSLGVIELARTSMSDEEVAALAAMLRGDTQIRRLVLSNNHVTDDGAQALASVLSGKTGLHFVDLRGNKLTSRGIGALANSLGQSEHISHVYVHASGKIEAFGLRKNASIDARPSEHTGSQFLKFGMSCAMPTDQLNSDLATACLVDCRENNDVQTGDSTPPTQDTI